MDSIAEKDFVELNPLLHQVAISGSKLTPMVSQYLDIKKNYFNVILFYRMGDFYELFFDDAIKASKILGITLTHRGKIGDVEVPMAGIPYHSATNYVDKLTNHGMRVAICEQVEDPKLAKGIVKREVVEVVGPGMPYDLDRMEPHDVRYITALWIDEKKFYHLVYLDFTTGDFGGFVSDVEDSFYNRLLLLSPKEVISFPGQFENYSKLKQTITLLGPTTLRSSIAKEYFNPKMVGEELSQLIPNLSKDQVIKQFSSLLFPLSALSFYLSSSQMGLKNRLAHLRPFHLETPHDYMTVSMNTLLGLEIVARKKEEYRYSLLGFMDKTKTPLGPRTLRGIFLRPLRDLKKIKMRYEFIQFWIKRPSLLKIFREDLTELGDIERVLAKVSTSKVNSSDLHLLARTIRSYSKSIEKLKKDVSGQIEYFEVSFDKLNLTSLIQLEEKITSTINNELGASLENGNLILKGISKIRDEYADLRFKSSEKISLLEKKYRDKTAISNLKIKFNSISGYFIEISKSHLSKVTSDFERKQTLVNSERYTTRELDRLQNDISLAEEKLEEVERELFNALLDEVKENASTLMTLSTHIGYLDTIQSFAFVALEEKFSAPDISEHKRQLKIIEGKHPLIASLLKSPFVPHDINLSDSQFFGLITGPNMAGKTTLMREMAIIQFLAQIGSFVPAKEAHLGICDHLFSRLGASDDILRGQSTFMVEMAETAEILRHATSKSFIVIDEVGRGTSTYDGLSIAWALTEYLVSEVKAITLFSTHYHELVTVVDTLDCAKNYSVETKVNQGDVTFLYRLLEEGASESYGIYVAKLAGLPSSLLNRSMTILKLLEDKESGSGHKKEEYKFKVDSSSDVLKELNEIDLMNITPIQAMDKLYKLKEKFFLQ